MGVDVVSRGELFAISPHNEMKGHRPFSLFYNLHQLFQVPFSPGRDRVGEARGGPFREGDAFYFDITRGALGIREEEIDARALTMPNFTAEVRVVRQRWDSAPQDGGFDDTVGEGGVHSYPDAFRLHDLPGESEFSFGVAGV